MEDIALLTPLERTAWLLLVLVLYLRLKGLSWHDTVMLPLGGVVWAWVVGALAAFAVSLSNAFPSYEQGWLWLTSWLVLVIVPIYVWRRVPAALLPRVTLSELIFWNVTVISISLGGWVGRNPEASAIEKAAVIVWSLLWLWPSALALVLGVTKHRLLQILVKLPLLAYIWASIAYWLVWSLLDREATETFVLFDIAVRLWESFAAIEIYAVLYLVYFFSSEENGLDFETRGRVAGALEGAIELDVWNAAAVLSIAAVTGVVVTGFSWLNESSSWGIPVYFLLALPRTLSETLPDSETPPLVHARRSGGKRPLDRRYRRP